MLKDNLSIRFINQLQGGFPLCAAPFQQVAQQLGCDQERVLTTVEGLLQDGYLSRFGPLYDAQRMGGGLTLAAMAVPPERFEQVSQIVNAFPEVAHNYRREHRLNMWFVIATESAREVQRVIDMIAESSQLKVYDCPKQQEFFVGLQIAIDPTGQVETVPMKPDWRAKPTPHKSTLDDLDRQLIQQTQSGLPLHSEPYAVIAEALGEQQKTVLQRLQNMLDNGVIRRIGAVPNHYKLGLRGNGMTVWNIPDDRIDEIGQKIAALDFVSHCYQRPRHLPDWPYNLFAMVHGADKQRALDKLDLMQQALLPDNFEQQVLFSTAVLKKTGLRIAA